MPPSTLSHTSSAVRGTGVLAGGRVGVRHHVNRLWVARLQHTHVGVSACMRETVRARGCVCVLMPCVRVRMCVHGSDPQASACFLPTTLPFSAPSGVVGGSRGQPSQQLATASVPGALAGAPLYSCPLPNPHLQRSWGYPGDQHPCLGWIVATGAAGAGAYTHQTQLCWKREEAQKSQGSSLCSCSSGPAWKDSQPPMIGGEGD